MIHKIVKLYQDHVGPHFDVPAAAVGGGTGHILSQHTEITGMAGVDIFIKIVVPIVSGLVVPVIHKWFADRQDARNLRREELKAKEENKNDQHSK